MAVTRVSSPHYYTGASGDTKPTTGVPAGSVFWEFTAGTPVEVRKWIFDGSAWGLDLKTTEALA